MRPTSRRKLLSTLLMVTPALAVAQRAGEPATIAARVTVLAELRDSVCWEVTQSPVNPALFACTSSKNDLRMIDAAAHTTSVLVPNVYAGDLAWSKNGDRIAFYWQGEDGANRNHLWVLPVDPRTGHPTSAARQISLGAGSDPSISPDGRRVAYLTKAQNGTRRLVVMPAEGGEERMLAEGDVLGPLNWSLDGSAIYYSLRTSPPGPGATFIIYRVATDGGAPVRVMNVESPEIPRGMSPDGRYFASAMRVDQTGGGLGAITVRDMKGATIGRASVPRDISDGTGIGDDWAASPLQMFVNRVTQPRTLRVVDLATGATRELAHSADHLAWPRWSPDGRRITAQILDGDRVSLLLTNADGSDRHVFHTSVEPRFGFPVFVSSGNIWSPDSRLIAYRAGDVGTTHLHVVDAATGKDVEVTGGSFDVVALHWLGNSRGIRYIRLDRVAGTPRLSIHEAQLDGTDRQLRALDDITGSVQFVNADWLVSATTGTVEPVQGGAARRVHAPIRGAFAAVSADGQWIALAPNGRGSPAAPAQFDVVSFDGATTSTVKMPPGMASTMPLFAADNRALLVPNANSGSNGKTPTTPAQILFVPINGGTPRTLLTLPAGERFSGGDLSPDGKTLVYVGDGPEQQQLISLDLSALAAPGRDKKR